FSIDLPAIHNPLSGHSRRVSLSSRLRQPSAYNSIAMAPTFHDRPRFPRGFSCASRNCGLKSSGYDLALFHSEVPAQAAALFTRNRVPGAPIIVGRELIQKGRLRGIVVNSKVSNVGTGHEGIVNARRMGLAASVELGVAADEVLMSSTGVIGRQLPIERIE